MKALSWTSQDQLKLLEHEAPACRRSEDVMIRIELSGICGTDLAVITGKEPGLPGVIRGHEAAGTVIETGSEVTRVRIGDRVVIDPNLSCGSCRFCRQGRFHLCIGTDGKGMKIAGLNTHGTFAPFYVTNQKFVHKLPEGMSLEAAVLVEPLACVLHNFKETGITQEDRVLVIGSGPMGMLCQIVGHGLGCDVTATETNPYRLDFARRFSPMVFFPEELEKKSRGDEGRKYDVVIDTAGNQLGVAERMVERGGRIVPFGINGGYRHVLAPTRYTQNAVKLIGAGEYLGTFEAALQYAAECPSLATLVTKRYPLEAYEEAIQELLGSGSSGGGKAPRGTMKSAFTF